MQLWVLFAIVVCSSETRYYYPNSHPSYSYHRQFAATSTTPQPPYFRRGGHDESGVNDRTNVRNHPQRYPHYPSYATQGVVGTTTVPPSYLHRSINDVTVVDERTGIHYNPYSKLHPGRHVCTRQRNITHPVRFKRVFCKPTYKKYMVRCGTQWCEGVRLVYEKFHKEVVADSNHTTIDYTCCPGWTTVHWKSHGCNKPVCAPPCENGGKCVSPNVCSCPPGSSGTFCETKTSVYAPNDCCYTSPYSTFQPNVCPECLRFCNLSCTSNGNPSSTPYEICPAWTPYSTCSPWTQSTTYSTFPPCPPCPQPPYPSCAHYCHTCAPSDHTGPQHTTESCDKRPSKHNGLQATPSETCTHQCQNGGTCNSDQQCTCPPGYTGSQCQTDVDECKQKPCDQICYNSPGSYSCECKEDFVLQKDGQTCRSEKDEDALEVKDLEVKIEKERREQEKKLEKMDKRLLKIEKLVKDQKKNEVTRYDLDGIYSDIDKLSNNLVKINDRLEQMEANSQIVDDLSQKVDDNMIQVKNKLQALECVKLQLGKLTSQVEIIDKKTEFIEVQETLEQAKEALGRCESSIAHTGISILAPPESRHRESATKPSYILQPSLEQPVDLRGETRASLEDHHDGIMHGASSHQKALSGRNVSIHTPQSSTNSSIVYRSASEARRDASRSHTGSMGARTGSVGARRDASASGVAAPGSQRNISHLEVSASRTGSLRAQIEMSAAETGSHGSQRDIFVPHKGSVSAHRDISGSHGLPRDVSTSRVSPHGSARNVADSCMGANAECTISRVSDDSSFDAQRCEMSPKHEDDGLSNSRACVNKKSGSSTRSR